MRSPLCRATILASVLCFACADDDQVICGAYEEQSFAKRGELQFTHFSSVNKTRCFDRTRALFPVPELTSNTMDQESWCRGYGKRDCQQWCQSTEGCSGALWIRDGSICALLPARADKRRVPKHGHVVSICILKSADIYNSRKRRLEMKRRARRKRATAGTGMAPGISPQRP